MNYTREELYEKFENLPDNVREAFLSIDTYNTLKKITDKYKLHVDQAGKLSEEIGLVMLGVTRPESFLSNVQQKLELATEVAGEIVKDINLDIFFPIRESLEALNDERSSRYQSERAPLVENFSPAGQISDQNIPKPQTPLRNLDNNAIIINKEVEKNESYSGRQVFDEKMGKLFRLPKEEVNLSSFNQNPAGQSAQKPADPYREMPK